jgi:septal ring factor EnvC (AmiA/AmiB activator)
MKIISTTAIYTSLLLCAIALPVVQAQPATPRPITRDELRVCMNSEGELATQRQALEARGKRQAEEAAALRAEAAELAEERDALQQRQASMDRFERKVRDHNLRIKTAQTGADALRTDLETLNQALLAYNASCGLVSFSVEDKEAILKEREAAKK